MVDTGEDLMRRMAQHYLPQHVAAVLPAAPGWHVVVAEDTGLSDPSDPDTAYGKTFHQMRVLPLGAWGLVCPSDLYQAPDEVAARKATEGDQGVMGTIMDMVASVLPRVTGSSASFPAYLPLDPRAEAPTFLPLDQLVGVYPPPEGDAHAVLKKAEALVAERSERELKKRRSEAERRAAWETERKSRL